jgi:hypothetical protein
MGQGWNRPGEKDGDVNWLGFIANISCIQVLAYFVYSVSCIQIF